MRHLAVRSGGPLLAAALAELAAGGTTAAGALKDKNGRPQKKVVGGLGEVAGNL